MPRVVIPKSVLPPMSDDGSYTVRVRLVSDNKNAVSAWTPAYRLYLPADENDKVVSLPNQAAISLSPNGVPATGPQRFNITVTWEDPNGFPVYDIYARWYRGTTWDAWSHVARTSARTHTITTPEAGIVVGDTSTYPARIGIAVTAPTYKMIYAPTGNPPTTRLTVFNTYGMLDPADGVTVIDGVKLE